MGTLRYTAICSVDGYTADAEGGFAWAEPTPEVHAFVNEQERDVGTYVMGRRIYETMKVWDDGEPWTTPEELRYAALWQAAEKIVCSDTLTGVDTRRTTLGPRLRAERLREIVAERDGVVSIDGPTTAAEALRAGLVDDLRLYLVPHVVGGGTRALPDGARFALRLVDERRFANGTVFLHYARRPA